MRAAARGARAALAVALLCAGLGSPARPADVGEAPRPPASRDDSRAGAKRESREAVAYRKACDRGDMAACSSLAGLYVSGTGVARDEARAAALYRRACDGGSALGCASLEWLVARLVDSGQRALERAALKDDRLVNEEALRSFDDALAIDPSAEKARLGRAEAMRRLDDLRARAAAASFVQGGTAFVASPLAARGLEAVRLVIEATPSVVRPGDAYVLRYSLLNPSPASLAIGTVSVRNTLEGAGVTGGSVEPQSRTAAPDSRTLLVEAKGTWSYDATTAWATTLTVVLDDGSVYTTTLQTRRD